MVTIPVYKPSLDGNEKKYVNECLDSTWIPSKGKFVNEFEEKFADYTHVNMQRLFAMGPLPCIWPL